MKKFLFVLLLSATTFVAVAQETFVHKYNSCVTNIDDVFSETKPIEVTIVFNEGTTTDIVIYGLEKDKRFYRTGDVIKGKTNDGSEYQLVDCIQVETGYKVSIQLFDTAVRIFIDGDYVEYQK
jgi:hypothetical protein